MKNITILFPAFIVILLFQDCRGNKATNAHTNSTRAASGSSANISTQRINNAQVIVIHANTNVPLTTVVTATQCIYSMKFEIGSYYHKTYANYCHSIPIRGIGAIPFNNMANNTLTSNHSSC